MEYILVLEGQERAISQEVASSDATLRQALLPFFPELGTADIQRDPEKDGTIRIRVTKKAGTKGSSANILAELAVIPAEINPALHLAWQLKQQELESGTNVELLLDLHDEIEVAIEEGSEWKKDMNETLTCLKSYRLTHSLIPVIGF